jgi:hypothetical protein
MILSVENALNSWMSRSLAPALSAGGRRGDDQGEQPALGVDGDVPSAAGDLLSAVVAAGGLADGVVRLDHLRVHHAGRRLRGPSLGRAQQLPQPGDERLRQAAAVPPLEERVRRLSRGKSTGRARHSTPFFTTYATASHIARRS